MPIIQHGHQTSISLATVTVDESEFQVIEITQVYYQCVSLFCEYYSVSVSKNIWLSHNGGLVCGT